jgi:hypothetical protein
MKTITYNQNSYEISYRDLQLNHTLFIEKNDVNGSSLLKFLLTQVR